MWKYTDYIDGLEQERRNSIANALEFCLSCTNPTTYRLLYFVTYPITMSTDPGSLILGMRESK